MVTKQTVRLGCFTIKFKQGIPLDTHRNSTQDTPGQKVMSRESPRKLIMILKSLLHYNKKYLENEEPPEICFLCYL